MEGRHQHERHARHNEGLGDIMADKYTVKVGVITVSTSTSSVISMEELEQREAFWEDESQRIEADYIAQKAVADQSAAAVKAAIAAAKDAAR
jgi:uncharacterized small protein (DUF1192 family)